MGRCDGRFIIRNKELKKAFRTPKRIKSLKKYKKEYLKKQRKELIQKAKKFKPYDYKYFEDIVFHMLNMLYDFFKEPNNLVQDTKAESNKYDLMIASLRICCETAKKLNDLEYEHYCEETKARKTIYYTIGNFIESWWD